jgi:hypothetical protein
MSMVGCAPGPNDVSHLARTLGVHQAGFWLGLWHGIILPFTFIISLFNSNIGVYELNNCGTLYNLGFVLGVAGCFGGGVKRMHRKDKFGR